MSQGNNLFSQFACFLLSICSYTVRKYQGWEVYKEKIMYLGSFVAPKCKQHDVGSSETLLAAQCPSGWHHSENMWSRGRWHHWMRSLPDSGWRGGRRASSMAIFSWALSQYLKRTIFVPPKDSAGDLHVLLPKCSPPCVTTPEIKTPAHNKPLPHGG